ncbi:MAG: type II toxin-antitoxin system PemK/MazF family toxin [Bryobacteraceae bacterium]
MATRKPQTRSQIDFPRRGDIFLVASDPTLGHEIQKTRQAVVIQNEISNQSSPITIVAAISSQFANPPYPREVVIEPGESGLPKTSAVIANQIRSIDCRRLVKRMGRLDAAAMRRVDQALLISLGLVPL